MAWNAFVMRPCESCWEWDHQALVASLVSLQFDIFDRKIGD